MVSVVWAVVSAVLRRVFSHGGEMARRGSVAMLGVFLVLGLAEGGGDGPHAGLAP